MDNIDNSLYLVFVEFNPAKELKYKQNDIDNYNTWLYLRCNKHKPKIVPENTVAVGFASHDWLFNKGKMLGITIDGKLKMVDLTYRNYKIKPTYKITDGITKRSYLPKDEGYDVYTDNGNHKFTYYELHFMDLKRVTQYWNNIKSNPKKIPGSNLEIELNFCHPNPMPYAYKDLIDSKGPKWASPYKNLIDIKGAEWAGYLEDFPIQYCKDYDSLVKMALAKNELYLNPDKGEPSMADSVQPGNGNISLQVNGNVKGVFSVDQEENQLIDLGNYSTVTPSNCTITIKSNDKYLGSFQLNQSNDSVIDIGDSVNLDSLKAHDSTVKINYEDTNLGSFTTDQSHDSTIDISGINNLITKPNVFELWPDGAEAHNAMWGGRDITAAFDSGEFSEHVADGTFKDIFPGDYITKSVTISGQTYDVTWVVADCDYWINKSDMVMEKHHVVIVPQKPIFNANMNDHLTTEGGYAGSRMYRETIPACATGIVSAFGSGHILKFRDGISDSVDTSHVSSGLPQQTGTPGWWGTWVSVQCNLMSEKMVYGAPICSAGAMDNVMATRQMSAFRLSERLINYNRQDWWLRDVVDSKNFAIVGEYGGAYAYYASWVYGVRPFALLS